MEDKTANQKYLASIYWAVVTISTVGYGEIVPINVIEMAITLVLIFVGVSFYSYIISKLSNLFSSVKQKDELVSREQIAYDFATKQRFTEHLTRRIQYFFKSSNTKNNLVFLSKELDIEELLSILPPHLKAEISYHLYKEPIQVFRIL